MPPGMGPSVVQIIKVRAMMNLQDLELCWFPNIDTFYFPRFLFYI